MKTKEALALVGIAAVSGGAVHAGLQYDTMASARAQAITAEACGRAYDEAETPSDDMHEGMLNSPVDFAALADWHGQETGRPQGLDTADEATAAGGILTLPLAPGNYVVTQKTIDCLSKGWVQGGESVDTSNISVGEPEVLLQAFAKLEKSRGRHFDPSSVILWGLAGAILGAFNAYRVERKEERDQKEARGKDETEAAEEVRRQVIYDQETDTDEDPVGA